jgi:signal transduction histidine kinase
MRDLSRESTRDQVPQLVLDEALRLLGASSGWLWLVDRRQDALRLVASGGLPEEAREKVRSLSLAAPFIAARVARTGEPREITRAEATSDDGALLGDFGPRSRDARVLAYPLVARDGVIGVLAINGPIGDRSDALTRQLIRIIVEVAAQALGEDLARTQPNPPPAEFGTIDEWITLVSHDLRTSLGTIIGRASIIAARGDAASAEHARVILQSAWRTTNLVQDLSDACHLAAGRPILHRSTADLVAIAREVAREAIPHEDLERIRIVARGPIRLKVDRNRIGRVLLNLLINAVKYSAPGSPITVTIARRAKEAVVSVADQGIGIPSDDLPHVFEKSYRGKAAEQVAGLGLGLYISRLLVEAHGGTIGATSRVGEGSTFIFRLPIL